MSDHAADLERVRRDIESIREVAGLELPFGWGDVYLSVGTLVPGGVLVAVLSALAPLWYARLGIAATVLVCLVGLSAFRVRFRRATGRSPARRREYTLWLVSALVLGALLGGYLAWARGRGEPTPMLGGLAMVLCGGFCAILGISRRGWRSQLANAVVLPVLGLLFPFLSPRSSFIAAGVAIATIGGLGGAIMAWQLRSEGGSLEPATH